jgi:Coenzyme PQQ synthesis protein D (PqqD)
MKPRARKTGLVIRELEGELLVYDLQAHRAHRLNRTAALVFQACDGRTGRPELAARLRRELGVPADERWVGLAFGRLAKAGLLEDSTMDAERARGVSRREVMQRAGKVAGLALLLPAVISIVAPTPAEAAASCVTNCSAQAFGSPCRNSNPLDCGIVCICNGAGSCVLASDGITPCP